MLTCSVHPLPYRANPAHYFAAIRHAPGAVLLDSGRPSADRGRYDLLSAWPLEQLTVAPDESGEAFLQRLRDNLTRLGEASLPAPYELPFAGGLIGYLSYDFGRHLERLPSQASDDLHLPDARFGLYGWALVSDHLALTSQLVFHPTLPDSERQRLIELFSQPAPEAVAPFKLLTPMTADLSADLYQQAIERIQQYIQAGDCYQVNFAQRFRAPCQGDSWAAYCALREACPTPFSGFQSLPDGNAVLSLSPERFVKVSQRHVETRPIKGTRPRGLTPEQDAANAAELLASPKDRAENLMIVDLLRNDLGRTCRIGSGPVPGVFTP
ncbi:anthranilate/para-aminobenzoate synthase component I, partial [Pseudomonas sp. GM33]|uniref:anthranilate synthase component I family protein n=1 Tax=Pseudomonas sp. GM33 TaxID=1144329 RepID=UPI0002700A35